MVRTWQDFDENCRATWGMWFASISFDGHVQRIVGPFKTEREAIEAIGE